MQVYSQSIESLQKTVPKSHKTPLPTKSWSVSQPISPLCFARRSVCLSYLVLHTKLIRVELFGMCTQTVGNGPPRKTCHTERADLDL